MTVAAPPRSEAPAPRRRRFPIVGVILLVALTITMAGIFPFRQMLAQQRQVDQTQARLDLLVDENAGLERRITALDSDSEVERLAREQFGLVRPGETAYSIEPEERPAVEHSGTPTEEPIDERTLLQRAWDWLTGRDLVPDE